MASGKSSSSRFVWIILLLAILVVSAVLVSKKGEQTTALLDETQPPPMQQAGLTLEGSLANNLPANTNAFFEWNSESPAYTRFRESPWYGNDTFSLDALPVATDPKLESIRSALGKAGFDLNDRRTWDSVFAKTIVFITPGKVSGDEVIFGAYFESKKDVDLAKKLDTFRAELVSSQVPIEDHQFSSGKGFKWNLRADDPAPSDPATAGATSPPATYAYLAWEGSRGVLATAPWIVEDVIGKKYNASPAIVESKEFQKGTEGFPPPNNRIGMGYIDIAKVLEQIPSDNPSNAADLAKLRALPFKAASFVTAMTDTPYNDVRVLFDASVPEHAAWFEALGNSASQSFATLVPANSLLFLSIDGPTVKRVKELMLKQQEAQQADPMIAQQLAIFDDLKRIAIGARVAPVGQALLPFPDLLIALDGDKPSETMNKVSSLVMNLTAMAGMAQGQDAPSPPTWSEKNLGDVPMKTLATPMGITASVATVNNVVLVSSSEPFMEAAITNLKGTQVSLPEKVNKSLASEISMGSLYLNFNEIGSLIENMGGLLSMYAPQNQEAKKLMDPEGINRLKKMGALIGTVRVDDGRIAIQSYYHLVEPAKENVALNR